MADRGVKRRVLLDVLLLCRDTLLSVSGQNAEMLASGFA